MQKVARMYARTNSAKKIFTFRRIIHN